MARKRGKIPDFLRDAPTLNVGLELYWDAFGALTTCRSIGSGAMGPIPWTAIMQYCGHMEINDFDQIERMIDYLRAMDKTYIEHFSNKLKSMSPKWSSQTPSQPSPRQ